MGLCPFHSEKTPSFVVSDSKEIYKCFGCGKSGTKITFLMEIKNCSYNEAINYFSETYGIAIPIQNEDNKPNSYENDEISPSKKVFEPIVLNFISNISSIQELLSFDKLLLDFCINQIESLDERIRNNNEISLTNVRFYPTATLTQLKTIREHNSFKLKYETINNQSLVLLISYFTSTLKEIFKSSLEYLALNKKDFFKSIDIDFKISMQELGEYDFNLANNIGELVIKKKDINFQDMQSTVREFKNYLNVEISKNELVDNIILAQASRHSIVHSLSIADEKFINQISKTVKRSLKTNIILNDEIVFTKKELDQVILNLREFIDNLIKEIGSKLE